MTSCRHPFPDAINVYGAFYGGIVPDGYVLEPSEPEPESAPVAEKKPPPTKAKGRRKKRKALTTPKKRTYCPLHLVYIQELKTIWKAYPRVPTVHSRRQWATARGIEPAAVHTWFTRQKGQDSSLPEYALALGTPLLAGDEDDKMEDPVVKLEPSDAFLPSNSSLSAALTSAALTLVDLAKPRNANTKSRLGDISVSEARNAPLEPTTSLPSPSSRTTSSWLQDPSDIRPLLPDAGQFHSPVPPAPVPTRALLSSVLDTSHPPTSHLRQPLNPIRSPAHSSAPSQHTVSAWCADTPADFLSFPSKYPHAHNLEPALHVRDDSVPPWLLGPAPDCVMIPRALYTCLTKAARVYAPEIFRQFPLYDFINRA